MNKDTAAIALAISIMFAGMLTSMAFWTLV